jgi:hypothetical protein
MLHRIRRAVKRISGDQASTRPRDEAAADHNVNRQLKHLREATATLEWSTRRQMAFAEKLLESSREQHAHEFVRERVFRRLHRLTRGDGPIVIGPWTGEVGFELLYWTPFVRWAVERFKIDPSRMTLVSRGGTASWYGLEGATYRDVLTLCSSEEFRRRTAKARKQRTVRLFDRQILRQVVRERGGPVSVLHPAMMYALLAPFWNQRTALSWVDQFTRFTRIHPAIVPDLQLPPEYVAVRFYFSKCFPETSQNQALVNWLIESLAVDSHVVVLGSGAPVDEHRDVTIGRSQRVHSVDHLLRPENNLAVQTAVIGGAKAFVGTYGGFSYLAPLCGVDSVALYSRRNYYPHHLYLAQQVLDGVGGGSLTIMDAATCPLTRHLAIAVSRSSSHTHR